MFKHMYSTFLMKSGSVTNINYLDFPKEHMIQKLLFANGGRKDVLAVLCNRLVQSP